MMSEFHRNGKFAKGINTSFIVLIPKMENNQSLKMISKTLALRLRKVLDPIISENYAAFIGDKQILDGVMILNEILDEAKMKKQKSVIFKVDLEKAHDSVDWAFLDEMLIKQNFDTQWRGRIKTCVSSALFPVLINKSGVKCSFSPTQHLMFWSQYL